MAASARSDGELLAAWAEGDRRAGDELFTRHFAAMYRFFAGKIRGDVEDLVQSTFVACLEGRAEFRGEASVRTYLFAVARRMLYRHFRTKSRRGEVDFSVTSLQDLGPSPSTGLRARQDRRLLLEALRAIPLELQIALELHYWEELSGPEMAEVLDVPEGTVRSRLRRAREALEEQFARLAASPDLLASTLGDLDRWAASFKALKTGSK